MGLLIEGIGEDWVVMRRPGGRAELITFKSLDDMRRLLTRAMMKAEQVEANRRPPVVLPQATPQIGARPPLLPSVVTRPKYPPLPADTDCQTCGACCAPSDQRKDTHAALEPEDIELIPKIIRQVLVVNDGGHYYTGTKKNKDGLTVCAALSGSIGERCKCGIYNKRPQICRAVEKGRDECLAARAAFRV